MENASKALIIAGAILLAILLISLGIMIFNQAQDTVSGSGMSQAEVTAFNNKFTKYEGDQKGSAVKALIQEVKASNASDTAEGNSRNIKIILDKTEITSTGGISGTSLYHVEIPADGYDETGYVKQINLTLKTNKTNP